jgi:hypothetical protein
VRTGFARTGLVKGLSYLRTGFARTGLCELCVLKLFGLSRAHAAQPCHSSAFAAQHVVLDL